MTTEANPLDAVLAAYVAGALSQPAHVLVEAHLALSPQNRAFVAALERLAGRELSEIAPRPLSNHHGMLQRILAAEPGPARPAAEPRPVEPARAGRLPPVLHDFIGFEVDAVPWKKRLGGLWEHEIQRDGRGSAALIRVAAGRPVPSHTHRGLELTLVLEGAFADATGRYARGDVAIADETIDHRPIAEPGADCICFAVTDAPLRLTGPIGRLFAPFLPR